MAIILALGVATAINLVTVAVMWDAIGVGAEVSENGTQIIVGVLGGAIGVLGSYLGYSAALTRPRPGELPPTAPPPPPPEEEIPP